MPSIAREINFKFFPSNIRDESILGLFLIHLNFISEETIVFCSDLIPLKSHLKLPWIMGYDLNAELTLKEKKILVLFTDSLRLGLFYRFFTESLKLL